MARAPAYPDDMTPALEADIYPFDQGIIPFNRPVMGGDLETLRIHLGLKVHDMIWLLGMNTQSWYSTTADPVEKLISKHERKKGSLEEKLYNAEDRKAELEEELKTADASSKDAIEKKIAKAQATIDKNKAELSKLKLTDEDIAKAEAEREKADVGPDKPVRGSLALLVRFFDALNDYIDAVRLRPPSAPEFRDRFLSEEFSERKLGELLGRDASAAYRWFSFQAEPHPTAKRLIDMLMQWTDDYPLNDKGENNLTIWQNVVRREWTLRGWQIGKVRNPSEKTLPSRRPSEVA